MFAFTATITLAAISKVKAEVARLNRKAKRLGLQPMQVSVGQTTTLTIDHDRGKVVVPAAPITIAGQMPKIKGKWELVGVATRSVGTDVTTYPFIAKGFTRNDLPANTHCDHCNHKRNRRLTYYVVDRAMDFGLGVEVFRLGSSCVKDFFGDVDPATLAWAAEAQAIESMLSDKYLDEDILNSASLYRTSYVLSIAFGVADKHDGYVSVSNSQMTGKNATSHRVREALATEQGHLFITPDSAAKADDALEWLRGLDSETLNNDYMQDLVAVANADLCDNQHIGILASAVASYKRHLDTKAKHKY